jgi:hypothetical protein
MAGAINKRMRNHIEKQLKNGKDWKPALRIKIKNLKENSNYFRILQALLKMERHKTDAYLKA